MSQKINSQQEKYEKLQAQVSEYEKQLKRLKTIITVCERNKTQNTEWINVTEPRAGAHLSHLITATRTLAHTLSS